MQNRRHTGPFECPTSKLAITIYGAVPLVAVVGLSLLVDLPLSTGGLQYTSLLIVTGSIWVHSLYLAISEVAFFILSGLVLQKGYSFVSIFLLLLLLHILLGFNSHGKNFSPSIWTSPKSNWNVAREKVFTRFVRSGKNNFFRVQKLVSSDFAKEKSPLFCSRCYKNSFGGNLDFPKIKKLKKVCSNFWTCTKMWKLCYYKAKLCSNIVYFF